MMDRADDELVERFFAMHTFEIDDAGFSRRVERRLSLRAQRLTRVWRIACAAAGVALFVLTNGLGSLLAALGNIVGELQGVLYGSDPSVFTPLALLLTVLTTVSVWAYNVMTANR